MDSVTTFIFLTGMWEFGITELMLAVLKPGDLFLDVGANIGYHSLLAAKLVGPKGTVIAVEPAPEIRQRFEENLALNPDLAALGNINVIPYCASNHAGMIVLSAPIKGNSGETTLRDVPGFALKIAAEARTLDDILDRVDLSSCPLVKMDIEGAEYLAVSGMERTLQRHPTTSLILEVDDRFLHDLGCSAELLFDWFRKRGYYAYTIVAPRANLAGIPVKLRPVEVVSNSPENVLFTRVPERFAAWMQKSEMSVPRPD